MCTSHPPRYTILSMTNQEAINQLSSLKPKLSPEVFARASMLLKIFSDNVLFMSMTIFGGVTITWVDDVIMSVKVDVKKSGCDE